MVRKSHLQKKTKKAALKKRNLRSKKSIRKISRKTKGGDKLGSCNVPYGYTEFVGEGRDRTVWQFIPYLEEVVNNSEIYVRKYGSVIVMNDGIPVAYLTGSDTIYMPGNTRRGLEELNKDTIMDFVKMLGKKPVNELEKFKLLFGDYQNAHTNSCPVPMETKK
jgi:hypothetical protein